MPTPEFDYEAFFESNRQEHVKRHPSHQLILRARSMDRPIFYKEAMKNPSSEEARTYLNTARTYLHRYMFTKRTPKHKRSYLLPPAHRHHRILRQLLRFAHKRPLPHVFHQYLVHETTLLTLRPKHPKHQYPHPDTQTTWKQQLEQNPLLIAPAPC